MDNSFVINAGAAFLFGLLSFLSPCVLPLLPGYLSFITGSGAGNTETLSRNAAVRNSVGFILGFSILFIAMGAAASGIGQWLVKNQLILSRVAGVILIVFGLHISEIIPVKLFYRQSGWRLGQGLTGWTGAFAFGMSFAAGWTPCVGPVLASILLLAGSTQTLGRGILLLTFYSLGLAIPFMAAALGIGYIHKGLSNLTRILPFINAISGGLLIAMGILLITGQWDKLMLLFY
ncbi:cytochrome c-type biogenesis protein [Desulfotomaculum arcticum]|uniref:Cytochrome c-type biogenesis protein n=1 Tax=Desulfotruncus arcticus DSM 17038 TaxID=1121424 RepID=A0A1I2TW14_9FIRM|nr:cytochrome c biogenesis protein CcdA [Desulfotruncus arcticus]SFG69054.1 cytochrome c-type biogenesis protein [Desulfotomaculum arcticum] [Desulfotruncus arcticus DSM 17038]